MPKLNPLFPKSLPPASALRVVVRLLTQTDSSAPLALAQPVLKNIIGGGRVVNTPVVPNGNIIHILPLEADLQIMVFDDELDEPVKEVLALLIREAMDALDVVSDSKH